MSEYVPRLTRLTHAPRQIRHERNEPAIYMCKETAENGVLLTEYSKVI